MSDFWKNLLMLVGTFKVVFQPAQVVNMATASYNRILGTVINTAAVSLQVWEVIWTWIRRLFWLEMVGLVAVIGCRIAGLQNAAAMILVVMGIIPLLVVIKADLITTFVGAGKNEEVQKFIRMAAYLPMIIFFVAVVIITANGEEVSRLQYLAIAITFFLFSFAVIINSFGPTVAKIMALVVLALSLSFVFPEQYHMVSKTIGTDSNGWLQTSYGAWILLGAFLSFCFLFFDGTHTYGKSGLSLAGLAIVVGILVSFFSNHSIGDLFGNSSAAAVVKTEAPKQKILKKQIIKIPADQQFSSSIYPVGKFWMETDSDCFKLDTGGVPKNYITFVRGTANWEFAKPGFVKFYGCSIPATVEVTYYEEAVPTS